MRASLQAAASTLLLSALAALPAFGVDMNLSALDATARSLGVSAHDIGLTISLFIFACAAARSLSGLLAWRPDEGMGAGVATSLAIAINNDLFAGPAAEVRIARLASAMLLVPMLAPAVGSAVLALAGWRGIFVLRTGLGGLRACIVWCGFAESLQPGRRAAGPAALLRGYASAIRNPACLGHSLVNAAGFGMMFAWLSGSPLLLVECLGPSHAEYGLAYAASFAGVIAGVQRNLPLGMRGVASDARLQAGIMLSVTAAAALLVAILAGWRWAPGLIALLMRDMAGFGLIAPDAIAAAIRSLPDHAGAASAMAGFIQVLA